MKPATLHLLAADEPPAVSEYRTAAPSPFFLVCDHASNRIPRSLGDLGVRAADLKRHIAWDVGIEPVGRMLADQLDAHLVMSGYSRLVIDCNRPPGTEESIVLESDGTAVAGNCNLTVEAADARRREMFAPYHDTITAALDARKAARRDTFLIALHSFTPVYAGVARPWHAGLLYNKYNGLAHPLRDALREGGVFNIGDMEPYTVDNETDYTIPVHGEQRGIPHVAIEIRHDLIEDEKGQREWADRLAQLLPRAAQAIG